MRDSEGDDIASTHAEQTETETQDHSDTEDVNVLRERLRSQDKRIKDEQEFIGVIKSENKEMRERLSRLEGGMEALGRAREEPKTKEEDDELTALERELSNKEFCDEVDATPSKGLSKLIAVLKAERRGVGAGFERIIKTMPEIVGRIAEDRFADMPMRRQIDEAREVIDELRKDPDYNELPDRTLLKIAKGIGKAPEDDGRREAERVEYQGSPSAVGRRATGKRPPQLVVEHALDVARQFHPRDEKAAQAYVKRYLQGKGYSV